MATINIHEAKTNLSKIIARVVAGEEVVISRSGEPVAKLVPLAEPPKGPSLLGLLRGQIDVPDDFETMFDKEIEEMFGELTRPA